MSSRGLSEKKWHELFVNGATSILAFRLTFKRFAEEIVAM